MDNAFKYIKDNHGESGRDFVRLVLAGVGSLESTFSITVHTTSFLQYYSITKCLSVPMYEGKAMVLSNKKSGFSHC